MSQLSIVGDGNQARAITDAVEEHFDDYMRATCGASEYSEER